jgi:hypothetical protein
MKTTGTVKEIVQLLQSLKATQAVTVEWTPVADSATPAKPRAIVPAPKEQELDPMRRLNRYFTKHPRVTDETRDFTVKTYEYIVSMGAPVSVLELAALMGVDRHPIDTAIQYLRKAGVVKRDPRPTATKWEYIWQPVQPQAKPVG